MSSFIASAGFVQFCVTAGGRSIRFTLPFNVPASTRRANPVYTTLFSHLARFSHFKHSLSLSSAATRRFAPASSAPSSISLKALSTSRNTSLILNSFSPARSRSLFTAVPARKVRTVSASYNAFSRLSEGMAASMQHIHMVTARTAASAAPCENQFMVYP